MKTQQDRQTLSCNESTLMLVNDVFRPLFSLLALPGNIWKQGAFHLLRNARSKLSQTPVFLLQRGTVPQACALQTICCASQTNQPIAKPTRLQSFKDRNWEASLLSPYSILRLCAWIDPGYCSGSFDSQQLKPSWPSVGSNACGFSLSTKREIEIWNPELC